MARRLTIRLVIAGSLLVALHAQAPAQEAPKKSADIVVHSVKVQTTKKNKEAWDVAGGAPDLKVFIRKKGKPGQSHTTKTREDVFDASFGERTIRVSVGDEVEVIVYDQDAQVDDVVGKKTARITASLLTQREVTWSFDQVISLVLEFEP